MRKLTVAAALILGVLMSFGGVSLADEAKKTPSLPEYTKAPYHQVDAGSAKQFLHQEREASPVDVYADTEYLTPQSNVIGLFKDKNDKAYYAEWLSHSEKVIRGYALKDGAWVFEGQKTFAEVDKSRQQ